MLTWRCIKSGSWEAKQDGQTRWWRIERVMRNAIVKFTLYGPLLVVARSFDDLDAAFHFADETVKGGKRV